MSDLTRRVLEAVQGIADTHVCDQPDIEYSLDILADAAPILARQVEAVEALADELDREASEHVDRPVYSRSGTRIRTALNGGEK